jgi:hypothetical protein
MSDEMAAASKSTLENVVGRVAVPGEFEARAIASRPECGCWGFRFRGLTW